MVIIFLLHASLILAPVDSQRWVSPSSPTHGVRVLDAAGETQNNVARELTDRAPNTGHSSPGGLHGRKHHGHPHVAILFLFVALTLGGFTTAFLSRYLPSLPYTCVMLVEGFLVGLLEERTNSSLGVFSESLDMWTGMDPHLLLFTFLPALLFGDSMGLNWHMWKRCLPQCLLLAVPGVLIGTFLTALIAYYVLPYEWKWNEAMMYGSILAATDPVAVVGILKELGAPPRLTMCVSGEALLNDGTAIVLFNLFKALTLGTPEALAEIGGCTTCRKLTPWLVAKYALWMSVGGCVLGVLFGLLAVTFLSNVKQKTNHADALVQITTTLCLAYLTFFVGEYVAGVSGVLATVCAALTFAATGWPHLVSRDTMSAVWHCVEYVMNTLIFFLAGTIMGDSLGEDDRHHHHLESLDFLYVLITYSASMAIRFFMVVMLFPCLSRVGNGFSCKDAFMLSWGGLRGAVGLALALDVDLVFQNTTRQSVMGSKILLHVAGMAVLTLLINGITSAPLLRLLGMVSSDQYHEKLLEHVGERVVEHCRKIFDQEIEELDNRISAHPKLRQRVEKRVQALQNEHRQATSMVLRDRSRKHLSERSPLPSQFSDVNKLRNAVLSNSRGSRATALSAPMALRQAREKQAIVIREVYLAMMRSKYLELVERGVLSDNGQVMLILNESIDVAADCVEEKLNDWKAIQKSCITRSVWNRPQEWAERWFPSFLHAGLFEDAGLVVTERTVCCVLLCFVTTHRQNQDDIKELLSSGNEVEEVEGLKAVLQEVEDEVTTAEKLLGGMDPGMVQEVMVQQVTNVILQGQLDCIEKMVREGCLQEKQAHHLLEDLSKNIYENERHPREPPDLTSRSSHAASVAEENSSVELT